MVSGRGSKIAYTSSEDGGSGSIIARGFQGLRLRLRGLGSNTSPNFCEPLVNHVLASIPFAAHTAEGVVDWADRVVAGQGNAGGAFEMGSLERHDTVAWHISLAAHHLVGTIGRLHLRTRGSWVKGLSSEDEGAVMLKIHEVSGTDRRGKRKDSYGGPLLSFAVSLDGSACDSHARDAIVFDMCPCKQEKKRKMRKWTPKEKIMARARLPPSTNA